jgi:hypothetical protein
MPSTDATRAVTPVEQSHARFAREVATHQLEVLRDDELYRHLRFQRPDTSMYWFDLITWPGVLTISGDCGCYVFSRTRDMFEFFRPSGARGGFSDPRWGINPDYWSEKLRAPTPDAVEVYSHDLFKLRVAQWLEEQCEQLDDAAQVRLREAVREQITEDPDGVTQYRDGAIRALHEFRHEGIEIYEPWDWSLREYDWSFLWCCWAIVWGIEQYDALHELTAAERAWQEHPWFPHTLRHRLRCQRRHGGDSRSDLVPAGVS